MPRKKHPEPYVTITTRIPQSLSEKLNNILYNPYTQAPTVGARQAIIVRAIDEFCNKHDPQYLLDLIKEN